MIPVSLIGPDVSLTSSEEEVMSEMLGKPAVPFNLTDLQGNHHRLADTGGQWLLLVFHRHLG